MEWLVWSSHFCHAGGFKYACLSSNHASHGITPRSRRNSKLERSCYFWHRSTRVICFSKSGECIKPGNHQHREAKDCHIWKPKKQELQAIHLVELGLRKPETGFNLTLNAFSVPHICSDLQGHDLYWVKENYTRLQDIKFADTSPSGQSPMQIDLLIGSDYIWNFFVDAKTIQGEESGQGGPVAVSTTVGWVLSGPVKNLPYERLLSVQFSSTHVLRVDTSNNELKIHCTKILRSYGT